MLPSVEVREYMQTDPPRVSPDEDLFAAVRLMVRERLSGVCVVDEAGRLVGVLSELDCLRAILVARYENRGSVGKVGDFMTTEVVTASPRDDIVDVAADMLKNRHRRRPVVEEGRLVGQITCRRLLRAVTEFAAPSGEA